jgi:hypothetical protein
MTFTFKAIPVLALLLGLANSYKISDGGLSISTTSQNLNILESVTSERRKLFSTTGWAGDLWGFDLVDSEGDGVKSLSPHSCVSQSVENVDANSMDLVWQSCGEHEIDVILHAMAGELGGRPSGSLSFSLRNAPEVTLPPSPLTLPLHLTHPSSSSTPHSQSPRIGIYQLRVNLPLNANETISESDTLFVPDSFGVQAANPMRSMPNWSGTYPSAGCSMQFFAYGNEEGSFYLGAHDKDAVWKQLFWDNGVFSFLLTPEDATLPLSGGVWDQAFPIVFADLQTGVTETTPLWYAASAAYRDFIFDDQNPAPWVSKGSITSRLPDYLKESDVWINTGWQCVDIFEPQQGDPSTVYNRVSQVVENWRSKGLDIPIGLHYYEWQQGPDEGEENRYKFDTHYPDYFPGRVSESGEGLKSASNKLLEESDVYVYPYINGRIFDLNSTSFLEDEGEQYCVKVPQSDQVKLFDPHNLYDLVTTTESYGSGPTFCVANPYEEYWQQKISDTVEKLVKSEGSSGVYIDQVASAAMQLCFDPAMGHTLGNGGWWAEGYRAMMKKIRAKTSAPIVTESNSEVYMDMVEGYLILTVFFKSFAKEASTPWSVPAFASVYGGYYNAFGAEFYASEFKDLTYSKAKLAKQLIYGSQLGWFSLEASKMRRAGKWASSNCS